MINFQTQVSYFGKFSSLRHALLMIAILHTPLIRPRIRNLFALRRDRQHYIRSCLEKTTRASNIRLSKRNQS